jgi:hypothetical protein
MRFAREIEMRNSARSAMAELSGAATWRRRGHPRGLRAIFIFFIFSERGGVAENL